MRLRAVRAVDAWAAAVTREKRARHPKGDIWQNEKGGLLETVNSMGKLICRLDAEIGPGLGYVVGV